MSALDWIDKPGQVVRNTLKGNLGGARRQAADFLFDVPDVLPGDWIPNQATREDDVSGSDLIGLDKEKHPFLGFLGDVGIGTVTDPWFYLGLAQELVPGGQVTGAATMAAAIAKNAAKTGAKEVAEKAIAPATRTALKVGVPFTNISKTIPGTGALIEKAGDVLKAGYNKLPEGLRKNVSKAGHGIRQTFAAEKPGIVAEGILQGARAARTEGEAGMKVTKEILKGTDTRQRQIIGDAVENIRFDGRTPVGELASGESSLAERIAAHPELRPGEAESLTALAEKVVGVGRNQKARPGIFSKASQENLPDEYLMRSYKGLNEEDDLAQTLASSNPMKERTLKGWEDIRDMLMRPGNEKVEYQRDILERMLGRSRQQGTAARRADLGAGVMEAVKSGKIPMPEEQLAKSKLASAAEKEFSLDDDTMREAVGLGIEQLKKAGDIDGAKLLTDAMNGMPQRGWFGKFLNWTNGIFKPSATAGYIVPRLAFNVRNRLSSQLSALANPEARQHFFSMGKRIGSDLIGSIADGLGLSAPDRLGKVLNAWEGALAHSGGSAENAYRIMEQGGFPKEAALLRSGILDGFVRSEDIVSELTKPGVVAKLHRAAKWPAKIAKGVEDRMRLGLALDAMDAGKAPMDAAKIARDTLFDYDVTSSANRAYRTGVPFGQYMAKAIPQQTKFMAERPEVAVLLSQILQDRGDPVYPWMQGKTNIPLPSDAEGNDQYITGLGLPFEALNMIPNPSGSFEDFGRDLEKNVVGSSSPILKTLFGVTSGEDSFFETPYGSYDKIPAIGHMGELGQNYNKLAGTGLIQPIDSILRTIDDATDPRHNLLERLADTMTGINIASVDPERALQQQLESELTSNPSIRQYRSFYDPNGDPEAAAILEAYAEAKKKVKAKRAAGAP